jgi:hypothetical protein
VVYALSGMDWRLRAPLDCLMCDLVLFRSTVLTLGAATRRPEPEERHAGIEQGRKSVSSRVI